jgi:hypothetical protein
MERVPHQSVVRCERYQGTIFLSPFFFFLLVDSVLGSALAALPAVGSAAVPVVVLSLLVPAGLAAGAVLSVAVAAGATVGGVASGFPVAGAGSAVGAGVVSVFIGAGSAEPSGAGATVSAGGVSVGVPELAGTDVSDPAGTVSTATEFPEAPPPPPDAMTPGAADPGFKISTADVASAGGCKFG